MEKNKKSENGLSKRFWLIIICISLFMIVFITAGIIIFTNREPEVIEQEEEGGYVTLNYSSETNALTISNAKPTTDTVGMKNLTDGDYFDFSVETDLKDADKVEYEISLIKDEEFSTISDKDIRIYLEKEDSGTYSKMFGPDEFIPSKNYSGVGSELGSMVIADVKKIKSGTDNYRLRIWMSDKALISTGNFSVEIDIHAIAK